MASVYIHIPFCKHRCHYCNFYSAVSLKYRKEFIGKLLKEINLRKNYLGDEKINTIYFGGGTPSLLSVDEIYHIINTVYKSYSVSNDAEITLEANPDDFNK